jgi:hypothetical protein
MIVLYSFQKLSVTLREHEFTVSENKVPRKLSGPKMDERSWQFSMIHKTNFVIYVYHLLLLEGSEI